MALGDAQSVAGHPDVAGQPLVPGRGERLDGAPGREGNPVLLGFDQVVELDQVDVVDAQSGQRALQLGPGAVTGPLTGLGGQEHLVAVLREERGEPQLGVTIGAATSRWLMPAARTRSSTSSARS